MSRLQLEAEAYLYYEHYPPNSPKGLTFVFFNALTGDTGNWEQLIAPALRAAGHGTLCYDYRGQGQSPSTPSSPLSSEGIIADAGMLLDHLAPAHSVLVGLSIGGLFAARALLAGSSAKALVLINTLRQDSARLRWIGDALVRAVSVGGLDLFRDLFLPLLVNEQWLTAQRNNFLKKEAVYAPLAPENGVFRLLSDAGRDADWDLPYEQLTLPTLVITGLQDHVFLEPAVVDKLSARLPNAQRLDIADAGHLIPAEQPEQLADALIRFGQEVM